MKNRIIKAAEEYKKTYYGNHSTEGQFYLSDIFEVKEAAENAGGGVRQPPLHGDRNSASSGLYDRLQEGQEGQQEDPAQEAILNFEFWQSLLISGEIADPKRYEKEVLEFYGDSLAGTHAPFYFMFMGFLGALDLVALAEESIAEGQEGQQANSL
jgi:hypothetical protein